MTSPDAGEADDAHFEVKRWTLINVPDRGYIAPYTGDRAKRFPDGYRNDFLKTDPSGPALYAQLTGVDRYPGYMPPEAVVDEAFPGDPDTAAEGIYAGRGEALYLYERPLPTVDHKQTAVLVEVEFREGHPVYGAEAETNTYWYKVEVLDDNAAYVPFLRGIVYTLCIRGIGEAGERTAADAYNGSYSGNISASLETAGLKDLSNGSSAIHVDGLDYTFLHGGTFTLMRDGTEAARYSASSLGVSSEISLPFTTIFPSVGLSRPPSIFSRVLFPAPLGPRTTINFPSSRLRST